MQWELQHLIYMNDIKIFTKHEKELMTQIQTIRIYSQDIGMEFSIEKYAMLIMKSGKRKTAERRELPNQENIKTLGEKKKIYKHLGILEVDSIKQEKGKIIKEFPWCNSYRRRKWTRRHEFKSWTRMIAFHIALIPLGKVWIQLFSLQLWVNSRTD